ncbi:RpiB/LacA/LacB family sugar-phosphate isomerase [Ileibacterium valens]|uniref:RpiB/LacA/LacB family sugar-phosphate isomerase n=1 Tax=Ileibacterium valens TaxID=1862668 RepID=UPI00257467CD|nr:RpiB/LacA/LacB family sugar-phosphate isomerase [Ileibacterium valens]
MIYLASDSKSRNLLDQLIGRLQNDCQIKLQDEDFEILEADVPPGRDQDFKDQDFEEMSLFSLSCLMAEKIRKNPQVHRGVFVDSYGVLPFIVSSKFPKIICALTSDEHSAKMTRDHNNANLITLGSKLVGEEVAFSIIKRFLLGKYSGGRHQIRIDMLNALTPEENSEVSL